MKSNAITSVIIWSIVAAALVILLVLGAVLKPVFYIAKGEPREIYSDEKDGNLVDNIKISWFSGNVHVDRSADDIIRVKETSRYNVEPMDISMTDGELMISQKRSFGFYFFGFGARSSDLRLSLPEKQYNEFVLTMTSGRSELSDIEAAKMAIKLTSGRLKMHRLKSENVKATMTSGNIEASGISSDKLTLKMTSGNAEINGDFEDINCGITSGRAEIESGVVPVRLDTDITSGKVFITIPDNDGFTLKTKKTSGKIESDFELKTSLDDDGIYTYGKGAESGRSYSVKITSGKFDLLKIR